MPRPPLHAREGERRLIRTATVETTFGLTWIFTLHRSHIIFDIDRIIFRSADLVLIKGTRSTELAGVTRVELPLKHVTRIVVE